ncbi:hypothetical protein PS15m_002989 [Mucor circinelloides]
MAYVEENLVKNQFTSFAGKEELSYDNNRLESNVTEAESINDVQEAGSATSSDSTAGTGKFTWYILFVGKIYSFISDTLTEKDVEKGSAQLPPVVEEEGPDGGYGWLVVLGAFAVQITSFGVVSSWGKSRAISAYTAYV